MARKPFSDDVKKKVLLWSDRHCCLCEKSCDVDIVVAHLDDPEDDSIDNAIPLCHDCHGKIGRYNPDHPIGTKYKIEELKTRREQIYEKNTSHLVPPIHLELGRIYEENTKTRVRTFVKHLSDSNPVKIIINHTPFVNKNKFDPLEGKVRNYYNGGIVWNFNPKFGVNGSFAIKKEWLEMEGIFGIEFNINVIDVYERDHKLLPFCYTYNKRKNLWSLEPTSHDELCKFMDEPNI